MKIVSVLGSPRKNGSSAKIASAVISQLKNNNEGCAVSEYYLNGLDIKGCQGCMRCKTDSESCVMQDDLQIVLKEVFAADIVLLSSPIYGGWVTAQMKIFIDRIFSFLKPNFHTSEDKIRFATGKKCVFICTQGADNTKHGDVVGKYTELFTVNKFFTETHVIRGCGLNAMSSLDDIRPVIAEAKSITQRLSRC